MERYLQAGLNAAKTPVRSSLSLANAAISKALDPKISATQYFRAGQKAQGVKGYKHGGKVKETGLAYLHKGEKVLTKDEAKTKALKAKCR